MEVELLRKGNDLKDRYEEEYKEKYGTRPYLSDKDQADIRFLIKTFGFEKSKGLISTYMRLPGENDWYLRRAHPISVLIENIHFINASLGRQTRTPNSVDFRLRFRSRCKKCDHDFMLECLRSDMERLHYNSYCEDCKYAPAEGLTAAVEF